MSTEIIIAAIGVVASVITAMIASRSQARTSAANLYVELSESQQKRIAALTAQLENNERRIAELQTALITAQTRIAALEGESKRKDEKIEEQELRIQALEAENVQLRALVERLQSKRATVKA